MKEIRAIVRPNRLPLLREALRGIPNFPGLTLLKAEGFTAPITGLLEQLYADGVANGFSDLDQAGLFAELARRNGMK